MNIASGLTAHPGERIRLIVRDTAGNVVMETDTTVRGVWVKRINQTLTLVLAVCEEQTK